MDMLAYDWDQLFKRGIAAETAKSADNSQSSLTQRMYIISPIDGQLQYLRRGKNVRQGEAEAIQEADFHLQSIAFHVSSMSMSTEPILCLCAQRVLLVMMGTAKPTNTQMLHLHLLRCMWLQHIWMILARGSCCIRLSYTKSYLTLGVCCDNQLALPHSCSVCPYRDTHLPLRRPVCLL